MHKQTSIYLLVSLGQATRCLLCLFVISVTHRKSISIYMKVSSHGNCHTIHVCVCVCVFLIENEVVSFVSDQSGQ